MKKIIALIVLTFVSTTSILAQSKEYVELSSQTKIYQGASTGSSVVTGDTQLLFTAIFNDHVLPPPFTQPVLEKQNGWFKLPMGWVQENDVKKTGNETITPEMLSKTYVGNFGILESGDTIFFAVQVIVPEESDDNAIVYVHLPDTKIICDAKRNGHMIEATRGIMIKFAEYEADRKELVFQLYRERDGAKLYNLHYGERWNTRRLENIMGDIETINTFDTSKLTKDDWNVIRNAIAKDGNPYQFYITANMLNHLSAIDIPF